MKQNRDRCSSISTSREDAVKPEDLRVKTTIDTQKNLRIMNVVDDKNTTRQVHSHKAGKWHQVPYKETRTKGDQRRMSAGSRAEMEKLFNSN